jgi:hypothetical protein
MCVCMALHACAALGGWVGEHGGTGSTVGCEAVQCTCAGTGEGNHMRLPERLVVVCGYGCGHGSEERTLCERGCGKLTCGGCLV